MTDPAHPDHTCPTCGVSIDRRAAACRKHRAALFTPDTARAAVEARWEKEKHMDTLLESVLRLDDTLRSHLSAIHIDDDPDRPLTARLSISIMVPYGVVTEAGPYTITVDLTDLEEGVTHSSWTRWPTITRSLTGDIPILDQIQQLQNSGLVGDLDVATFEPTGGPTHDHPARRWVIKPLRIAGQSR